MIGNLNQYQSYWYWRNDLKNLIAEYRDRISQNEWDMKVVELELDHDSVRKESALNYFKRLNKKYEEQIQRVSELLKQVNEEIESYESLPSFTRWLMNWF